MKAVSSLAVPFNTD